LKRPACEEQADDLIVEMRFCHLPALFGILVGKNGKNWSTNPPEIVKNS
jgi:hypothetical protein